MAPRIPCSSTAAAVMESGASSCCAMGSASATVTERGTSASARPAGQKMRGGRAGASFEMLERRRAGRSGRALKGTGVGAGRRLTDQTAARRPRTTAASAEAALTGRQPEGLCGESGREQAETAAERGGADDFWEVTLHGAALGVNPEPE